MGKVLQPITRWFQHNKSLVHGGSLTFLMLTGMFSLTLRADQGLLSEQHWVSGRSS